jgi:hypothetical protein
MRKLLGRVNIIALRLQCFLIFSNVILFPSGISGLFYTHSKLV